MVYYRLEICPTEEGRAYYKDVDFPQNDNAGFDTVVVKDTTCPADTVTLLPLGFSARMLRVYDQCVVMAGGRFHEEEVHFWLAPRSSIWKSRVTLANSMGVIDRTYRGELKAAVLPFGTCKTDEFVDERDKLRAQLAQATTTEAREWFECLLTESLKKSQQSMKSAFIKEGTRLTQILAPDMGWIKEVRIVESLPETARGVGGFGSTGLSALAAAVARLSTAETTEEKMTPADDLYS